MEKTPSVADTIPRSYKLDFNTRVALLLKDNAEVLTDRAYGKRVNKSGYWKKIHKAYKKRIGGDLTLGQIKTRAFSLKSIVRNKLFYAETAEELNDLLPWQLLIHELDVKVNTAEVTARYTGGWICVDVLQPEDTEKLFSLPTSDDPESLPKVVEVVTVSMAASPSNTTPRLEEPVGVPTFDTIKLNVTSESQFQEHLKDPVFQNALAVAKNITPFVNRGWIRILPSEPARVSNRISLKQGKKIGDIPGIEEPVVDGSEKSETRRIIPLLEDSSILGTLAEPSSSSAGCAKHTEHHLTTSSHQRNTSAVSKTISSALPSTKDSLNMSSSKQRLMSLNSSQKTLKITAPPKKVPVLRVISKKAATAASGSTPNLKAADISTDVTDVKSFFRTFSADTPPVSEHCAALVQPCETTKNTKRKLETELAEVQLPDSLCSGAKDHFEPVQEYYADESAKPPPVKKVIRAQSNHEADNSKGLRSQERTVKSPRKPTFATKLNLLRATASNIELNWPSHNKGRSSLNETRVGKISVKNIDELKKARQPVNSEYITLKQPDLFPSSSETGDNSVTGWEAKNASVQSEVEQTPDSLSSRPEQLLTPTKSTRPVLGSEQYFPARQVERSPGRQSKKPSDVLSRRETDETRGLSTEELKRLVLLEKLKLVRLKQKLLLSRRQ